MIGKVNDNLEIQEIVGTISESDEHDWTKALMRVKWYNNEPVFDIRRINFSNGKLGKGVTLTDDETRNLAKLLVEKDFLTVDELESNVTRIRKRHNISVPVIEEPLVINLEED